MTTLKIPIDLKDAIKVPKKTQSDTNWRETDLPPRYGIHDRTKPKRANWKWRSINLIGENDRPFLLLLEAAPNLAKFKAWLIDLHGDNKRVIARLEAQPGGTAGLHIHANCSVTSDTYGSQSIQMSDRLPDHGSFHRRQQAWTMAKFSEKALRIFRVHVRGEQEELL